MKYLAFLLIMVSMVLSQDLLEMGAEKYQVKVLGLDSTHVVFVEQGGQTIKALPVGAVKRITLANGDVVVQDKQLVIGPGHPAWYPDCRMIAASVINPTRRTTVSMPVATPQSAMGKQTATFSPGRIGGLCVAVAGGIGLYLIMDESPDDYNDPGYLNDLEDWNDRHTSLSKLMYTSLTAGGIFFTLEFNF